MGLFFPILLGTFALAIIIIGLFAGVATLIGFLAGASAYAKNRNIETFTQIWLIITGILIIGGLIWFVLWL